MNEWHLKIRYDLRMKGGVKTNDFLTLLHTEQTSLCKGDINVRTFMEKLNEARSNTSVHRRGKQGDVQTEGNSSEKQS